MLVLFLWMIVPLGMTLYFSVLNYNLLDPGNESFAGLDNFRYFLTDPAFFAALGNTLKLVGGVLIITVVGGIARGPSPRPALLRPSASSASWSSRPSS